MNSLDKMEELAAQVEVMRDAVSRSQRELQKLSFADSGITSAKECNHKALSITPSAALREIEARMLEDAANSRQWLLTKPEVLKAANAILLAIAAAKRKGE